MSFRVARHVFSAAARSSMKLRVNASMGAKRMNSSHAPKPSSDKPWIIASALIFGPAFLYLVSPSARKTNHTEHHDSHDFPHHPTSKAAVSAQKSEPVILKDDEGTVADVTEDLGQAEAEDVPKADGAESSTSTTQSASREHTESNDIESEEVTTQMAEMAAGAQEKSGTFQERREDGPTNIDVAGQAVNLKEGTLPKQKAEQPSSS